MNKHKKNHRIGLKDVYVAEVIKNNEGVSEVGVPVKLAKEISASIKTIKDTNI